MKPRLSIIVAAAANRVIGIDNRLPWKLPADLKHFKAVTLGHPVIMGRKTFESIGRPLPGRTNIVVSRNPTYTAPGCIVAVSLEAALEQCRDAAEAFIIGGAQLYRQALPLTDRIYLTEVQTEVEGDTFFPELDLAHWQETARQEHGADAHNSYAYRFLVYDRLAR